MSLATMLAGIMGGAGPSFNIGFSGDPWFISDFGFPPGDARSEIRIMADGTIWRFRLNNSNSIIGSWAQGTGFDANDYDFRWAPGGSNPNWGPSDPINTWINGGGSITWGEEETGIGSSSADGALEVRPAGGGGTIDTGPVTLYAESTP